MAALMSMSAQEKGQKVDTSANRQIGAFGADFLQFGRYVSIKVSLAGGRDTLHEHSFPIFRLKQTHLARRANTSGPYCRPWLPRLPSLQHEPSRSCGSSGPCGLSVLQTLQPETAPQRSRLPPTSSRSHRTDGPEATYALTFNMDHSLGAAHCLPVENNGRLLKVEVHAADAQVRDGAKIS